MIVRLLPPFIISFGVVLYLLLGYYSPSYAGLFGIVAALTACLFQGRHRPTRAELLEAFTDGLRLITLLSLLLIANRPRSPRPSRPRTSPSASGCCSRRSCPTARC